MPVVFLLVFSHLVGFWGVAFSAPILYFGRNRIPWSNWALLIPVPALWIWPLLMASPYSDARKAMGNVGEIVGVALAMPLLALVSVCVGRKVSGRLHAAIATAALCALAAAFFSLTPELWE
ncbi:MAG: hypothetical protein J0L84_09585 [Verrucomicrobia bacterium]|nr:hypothetical protein [Verrucomicrobiota bacterium]